MDNSPQESWQPDTTPSPGDYQPVEPTPVSSQLISWQASEYVHHEKDIIWFGGVAISGLVLVVLSLLLLQSWTFTVLVVVMTVAVIVLAMRPPRTLNYSLNSHGLQIDDKQYNYADFRAFGIQQDSGIYSLLMIPTKRFMPSVTVYIPPDQGEQIVDIIGSRIPMEKVEPDFVDRLSRKLRF